jgi:hypothetical protein
MTRPTIVVPTTTVISRLIKPPQTHDGSKEKLLMNLPCQSTVCTVTANLTTNQGPKAERSIGSNVTTRRTWHINCCGPCLCRHQNGLDQSITNAAPTDHVQQTSLASIKTSSLDETAMPLSVCAVCEDLTTHHGNKVEECRKSWSEGPTGVSSVALGGAIRVPLPLGLRHIDALRPTIARRHVHDGGRCT